MKALMVHGPNDLRIDDITLPEIGPEDALVRVAACGICGTDLTFAASGGLSGPGESPLALGHEFAGVIERVGKNARDLQPGARVVINPTSATNMIGSGGAGAFAPYILLKELNKETIVHPIPDDLAFDSAAMVEPLSVALHAVNRSDVKPGQRVAVFGVGPIGLGIVLFLHKLGVEDIVAVDMSEQRLQRAKTVGAKEILNPGSADVRSALAQFHGAASIHGWPTVMTDTFFDASGASSVIPQIIDIAPFGGRLVVVAVHHEEIKVNFQTVLGKEMTIVASMAYPNEFAKVLDMLVSGEVDVAPMISHHFEFSDVLQAFATAKDHSQAAKVMVMFEHS